jgi:hypothetical protein
MVTHDTFNEKIHEEINRLESRLANAEKQLSYARGMAADMSVKPWQRSMAAQDAINWHNQIVVLERMIEIRHQLNSEADNNGGAI